MQASPEAPCFESDPDIAAAAAHIRGGGLVVMPTETVYGLAADAGQEAAVAAIFAAKGRPTFDPLIVHVVTAEQAWTLAEPRSHARALAAAFWPGPLTLVLPRRPGAVADLVTSGMETVAIRCPAHPLALALLRASGRPLAAPSANRFGRTSPTTVAHVGDQFAAAGARVLDGGPCPVGVESTVLSLIDDPLILRPGGITPDDLARVIGFPPPLATSQGRAEHLPAPAPGMLASHYAPEKGLHLRAPGAPWPEGPQWGICAFSNADLPTRVGAVEVLSAEGDVVTAASRLFACLRRLDGAAVSQLCAELVPDHGLGLAINDRLRRAAGLG